MGSGGWSHGRGHGLRRAGRSRHRVRCRGRNDIGGRGLVEDRRIGGHGGNPDGAGLDRTDRHLRMARVLVERRVMAGGRGPRLGIRRLPAGAGLLPGRGGPRGDPGGTVRHDDVEGRLRQLGLLRCHLLLGQGVRSHLDGLRHRPCDDAVRRGIHLPEVRRGLQRQREAGVHRRGRGSGRRLRVGVRVHERLQLRVLDPADRRRVHLRRHDDRLHLQDPPLRGARRGELERHVHRRGTLLGGPSRGLVHNRFRGRHHL